MAIDALVGGLVAGGAEAGAGAAVGADVAAGFGAADAAAGLGAADVAATDLTAAALTPDLTASIAGTGEAGLAAAETTFGPFDPALFAANEADVAAGGFGTDLSTLTAAEAAPIQEGFFAGAPGDLVSGAGLGPGGTGGQFIGGGFDQFTGDPIVAENLQMAGAQGDWQGFAPDITSSNFPGQQGFGAAPQDTGPMVSSEATGQGIVDPGNSMDATFNQFTTTDQGASLPTDMANRVGATAVPTQSTTLEQAFPGSAQSITGETAASTPVSFGNDPLLSPTSLYQQGGLVPGTGIEAAPGDFTGTATQAGGFTPGGFDTGIAPANVTPSPQMIAGAPDYAAPGGMATATPTGAPIASSPLAPATAPATPAAAPGAAAGGTDALTALRMGAAGASIVNSGLNIANALNQPSYQALQPIYYPGSPMANPGPPFNQGVPGSNQGGGLTGGLSSFRLTNDLINGASVQQMSLQGLISPQRAERLQTDYNGIAEAYAQSHGISPQSLSPAVKKMIAARAIAENGLGGR